MGLEMLYFCCMKKISAIGFDWGGVILQNIDKSFADTAANFLHVDNEKFRHAYFLYNHMINKGANSKAFDQATEMWNNILSELGFADRLEIFMEFVQSRPKGEVSQDMIELIQRLKNNGWKIGLLSNASAEGTRRIRNNKCLELFDVTLFSAEIDYMKPESDAFIMLADKLGVPIKELVFIDDSEHSLSTANEVGYIPVCFKNTDALIDQLQTLGVLI